MSVTFIIGFEAAQGKAADLLALLQQGRDFAVTVEGFEAFEVYQGKDDPHRFVMVERWSSEETHRAHFERNVKASGVLDRAEALMTEPFKPPQEYCYVLR